MKSAASSISENPAVDRLFDTAAELFSQLFSLQLEIAIANAGSSLAEKGRELHNRLMARLGALYPVYGFASNAGYSSRAHLDALGTAGACPFHRKSFAPLRQMLLDM